MESAPGKTKKRSRIKKILLWIVGVLLAIIVIAAIYLHRNFNRLLSDALIKTFNSSIISDVYELKFEKLQVNLFLGNIQVYNVTFQPREKPLNIYTYINSSVRFSTQKILLTNVEISTLLKSHTLRLERIEIRDPDIQIQVNGSRRVLFPFKDTSTVAALENKNKKRFIESFFLKQYELVNASFHINNSFEQREFTVSELNISFNDLRIDQETDENLLSYKSVDLSIGEIKGHFRQEALKHINLENYKLTVDSLDIRDTPDTTIFHFADFSTGLEKLDVQSADSIFHLTMGSFDLSYKDKSVKLSNISFKPNISEAAFQKMFKYQTPQFSGTIGSLDLLGLNFDSVVYRNKIFVDEIALDKVSVSIFKDQTKPIDKNHFPSYPGQQIKSIPMPLLVKQLKATNMALVNREKKPNGSYGKVSINNLALYAKNITSIPSGEMLTVDADGYIQNKAHAHLSLGFHYDKPQFSINGNVKKFNLPDLNPFLQSYTPASITKGTLDEISFSGNAYRANASGTMKFLYHDLEVDVQLQKKATWTDDVLSFAANTVLPSANPSSENNPPRIVQFHVTRDMNKGFVNILIKSILNGIKETVMMSKENKKVYREAKKKAKKKNKGFLPF